jgi:hypothetical protein
MIIVDQFAKSVTKLTGQVRAFEENFANEDAEMFMEDTQSCETALQQLYDYAKREEPDLKRCYPQLETIADCLKLAKNHVKQKMETVDLSERSVWIKSLDSISTALRTVDGLKHLAQGIRRY